MCSASSRALSFLLQRDTVLILISGGGSALLTVPADGLVLSDLKTTTAVLARAGASIKVRRRLRNDGVPTLAFCVASVRIQRPCCPCTSSGAKRGPQAHFRCQGTRACSYRCPRQRCRRLFPLPALRLPHPTFSPRAQGGRLAEACHPAQVATLILSDVVGDPLDVIASGPTVPDGRMRGARGDCATLLWREVSCTKSLPFPTETSYADCLSIIQRLAVESKVPDAVMQRLQEGGLVLTWPRRPASAP